MPQAGGSTVPQADSSKVPQADSSSAGSKQRWGEDWNGEVVHAEMVGSTFKPDVLRVREGTKIVWTNRDAVVHNVAMPADLGLVGKPLKKGESFSLVAGSPGDYGFVCTFHPAEMQGRIHVVPE